MATRRGNTSASVSDENTTEPSASVSDEGAPVVAGTLVRFTRDVYEGGALKHAAGSVESLPDLYAAKQIRIGNATAAD